MRQWLAAAPAISGLQVPAGTAAVDLLALGLWVFLSPQTVMEMCTRVRCPVLVECNRNQWLSMSQVLINECVHVCVLSVSYVWAQWERHVCEYFVPVLLTYVYSLCCVLLTSVLCVCVCAHKNVSMFMLAYKHPCRASKHIRIRILICENQHQYAKNLKNMRNNDFAYWYFDNAFYFNFVLKQLVHSSVACQLT